LLLAEVALVLLTAVVVVRVVSSQPLVSLLLLEQLIQLLSVLVGLGRQVQLLLALQAAVILCLVQLHLLAEVGVVVLQRPQVLVVQVVVAQMVQMQVGPQVHQAKEMLVVVHQAQEHQTLPPLAGVVRARLVQELAQVALLGRVVWA